MKRLIELDGKQLAVEVTAYTLIIYEDRFKGRTFLNDADVIMRGGKIAEIPFSLAVKILWAAAKSADESLEDIDTFAKKYPISDILKNANVVVDMVLESLKNGDEKNEIAAVEEN